MSLFGHLCRHLSVIVFSMSPCISPLIKPAARYTMFGEDNRCFYIAIYSQICLKQPLSKRLKIGFQDQLSLKAGQRYCRMLQGEHSAILLTFIKLPFVVKTIVLSFFEWLYYTGFTVFPYQVGSQIYVGLLLYFGSLHSKQCGPKSEYSMRGPTFI